MTENTTITQRVVPVERLWIIILTDLGINPESILRKAKLPENLFAIEDAHLTVHEFFNLWETMYREMGDPLLPIRIGELITVEAFHPVIFAAICSPNLSIAFRRVAQYKRLIGPMRSDLEHRDEGFFVGIEWEDPTLHPPASLAAAELIYVIRIARIATRTNIRPKRVITPYPIEPKSAYEDFFGAPIVKGDEHGMVFTHEDAALPFLTECESMWQTFSPELRRRLSELDSEATLTQRVKSALLEALPSGEISIDTVSRRLGYSTRTLQRLLKVEDSSYSEIVKNTREQLSLHYITNTDLSYAEISFLIGFEEPSSFFRAFRDWTGQTPESIRATANQED